MNENQFFLKKEQPQQERNVLQALLHESKIMIQGLQNQEFLDYCFVKGACGQTIPLAISVPIGLFLGIFNIFVKATTDIIDGINQYKQGINIVLVIVQSILQSIGLTIVLYLLLKGCEIIPKKIKNPLLFGKITTYIFACLLITMGILVVERVVDGQARTYHSSQFWVVFALMIWQKLLTLFIYDYKIRFYSLTFLYIYYAFRISSEEWNWLYNLIKVIVYISLEFVMNIDRELKNYADYQLENNVQKKNILEGIIPSMAIFQQSSLLEQFIKIYPVIIFDQKKEILNISQSTLNIIGETNLLQAERILRKLEIIKVFNQKEKSQQKIQKINRQVKYGSTCGVDDNGELLHSLIHGPALQQLRESQQIQRQIIQSNILDYLLEDLINDQDDYISGILQLSISENKILYFQFKLLKQQKIYLFLDDITLSNQLDLKQKQFNTNLNDIILLTSKIRKSIQTQESLITTDVLNQEIKYCMINQQQLKINCNKIHFQEFCQKLEILYSNKYKYIKFTFKNQVTLNEFYNDEERILQIIDTLIINSIKNLNQRFIGIIFKDDPRKNCISIIFDDTGNEINISKLNIQDTPDFFIINYLVKILGHSFFNSIINGYISNQGLRIISSQDFGTNISFSLRNLDCDTKLSFYLIDNDLEDIEEEATQIAEKYLIDENTKFLNRTQIPIKYIIIKEIQHKIEQQLQIIEPIIQKPQMKGLMKLQQSGRLKNLQLKSNLLNPTFQNQCICQTILIINQDYNFSQCIKNIQCEQCTENESLKLINIKIKDNPCIENGCIGFKKIIINCSDIQYNYQELIIKLLNFNPHLQISVLTYVPYGDQNPKVLYHKMPISLQQLLI